MKNRSRDGLAAKGLFLRSLGQKGTAHYSDWPVEQVSENIVYRSLHHAQGLKKVPCHSP